MNTTTKIAHDHALRGLMMLVVEVQNIVRDNDYVGDFRTDIAHLVESPEAADLLQLARAALETP